MKLGYSQKKWSAMKAEARSILMSVAEQRGLITYSDVCARLQEEKFEPFDLRLWEVLGDVSRDEEAAGRGLLSVLVVHKHGDQEAGHGFTNLAKHFGRDARDKTKMFVEEVKRVHYYWSVTAKKKMPNKAPEPTTMLGTSAAEQPLVPSTVVAHL